MAMCQRQHFGKVARNKYLPIHEGLVASLRFANDNIFGKNVRDKSMPIHKVLVALLGCTESSHFTKGQSVETTGGIVSDSGECFVVMSNSVSTARELISNIRIPLKDWVKLVICNIIVYE